MAKRVYISPSDQVENKYAWGNTNEHVQCQRIAEAEAAALRRCGVEVQLAKFGTSMAQRCAESNAFGADIHNCVHTNAFNGKVTGTRLFCFAVPGKGYDACRAVFGALAPLTPGTSENIEAIARGLCQYLGVAYAPAQAEKPAPQPKGDGLFRVQVGAFANRNNAEKMLERLKKAGFSGFISSEK